MWIDEIGGYLFPTELRERWHAVHAKIMAGPNAEMQRHIDDGTMFEMDDGGFAALDALVAGACVCSVTEWPDMPAYWQLRDDKEGVPGSVPNAEAYCAAGRRRGRAAAAGRDSGAG